MGHDRGRALRYLDTGINTCRDQKRILITAMYCVKAYVFYTEQDYKSVFDVSNEYFGIDSDIKPGVTALDMEMYAIRASALYRCDRYKEAIKDFKRFFVIFSEVQKGNLNTADLYAAQLRVAIAGNYLRLAYEFMCCGLYGGAYDDVLAFIPAVQVYNYSENKQRLNDYIEIELRLLDRNGFERYESCFGGLNGTGKAIFAERLSDIIYSFANKDKAVRIMDEILSDKSLELKEFDILSLKLKNKIKKSILSGDRNNARLMLEEYEKIVPDDPETIKLYSCLDNIV